GTGALSRPAELDKYDCACPATPPRRLAGSRGKARVLWRIVPPPPDRASPRQTTEKGWLKTSHLHSLHAAVSRRQCCRSGPLKLGCQLAPTRRPTAGVRRREPRAAAPTAPTGQLSGRVNRTYQGIPPRPPGGSA